MLHYVNPNRKPITDYYRHIVTFDNPSKPIAIDLAHNMLLFGVLLSLKPEKILELGIGTGYVTSTILTAIAYNQRGQLTCVDSAKDWSDREPPHFQRFRDQGATIVLESEENFTHNAGPETYDCIISDADHFRCIEWLEKTIAILKYMGFIFFHDTNHIAPLLVLEEKIKNMGLNYYHFKENSRSDERCNRGWLMAWKNNHGQEN